MEIFAAARSGNEFIGNRLVDLIVAAARIIGRVIARYVAAGIRVGAVELKVFRPTRAVPAQSTHDIIAAVVIRRVVDVADAIRRPGPAIVVDVVHRVVVEIVRPSRSPKVVDTGALRRTRRRTHDVIDNVIVGIRIEVAETDAEHIAIAVFAVVNDAATNRVPGGIVGHTDGGGAVAVDFDSLKRRIRR